MSTNSKTIAIAILIALVASSILLLVLHNRYGAGAASNPLRPAPSSLLASHDARLPKKRPVMFEVEMGRGETDWRQNEKAGAVFQVNSITGGEKEREGKDRSSRNVLPPSFVSLFVSFQAAHQRQPPLLFDSQLLLDTTLLRIPPLHLPNRLFLSPHPPSNAVLSGQVPRRRRRGGGDPGGMRDRDRYIFVGAAERRGRGELGGGGAASGDERELLRGRG
ncbi:hypothetical protein BDY24DRAFT_397397 [Mrakia frigida]|uniref:uncharacterized protein n=1 Tax=Mrakia frigida TaxID=29902 RepID=UPI003FCC1EEC